MHTFPFCIAIAVLVADSLKSARCYIAQRHVQAQSMFNNLVNKIVNTEQQLTIIIYYYYYGACGIIYYTVLCDRSYTAYSVCIYVIFGIDLSRWIVVWHNLTCFIVCGDRNTQT